MGNRLVLDVQEKIRRYYCLFRKRAWFLRPLSYFYGKHKIMMIKRFGWNKMLLPVLFGILILYSCQQGEGYIIEGNLPDTSFDGEWMYVVPLVNAPVSRVDSTIIKDAKFTFKGKVVKPEVFVIRARPFLRLSLQELLVVKEPGIIQAYVGQNSSAKGTALNDSLQSWKEQKQVYDSHTKFLDHYYYSSNEAQRDSLRPVMDALASEKEAYHFEFASNNRENVVGELVIRMMKGEFSPEQRQELGIQDQ